jgi:proteasome lid subunit RPN8/RPN11
LAALTLDMISTLYLTDEHWQTMQQHVAACVPQEGCGLLAGQGDRVQAVIPITNAAHSPVRFRMDPEEQVGAFRRIEAQGWELVGIFHSHPAGPETPSPTDLRESAYEVAQLIWTHQAGLWQVRGFWLTGIKFEELGLEILNL